MPAEELIAGAVPSFELRADGRLGGRSSGSGEQGVGDGAHRRVLALRRQLIAYQEYAPAMAAPVRTVKMQAVQPAEVKQPWWSFLKQPQYTLGAAALVAFFIITPLTRHQSVAPSGAILAPTGGSGESKIPENSGLMLSEALGATELDNLPDSVRQGTKELLNAPESAARPAALAGLDSTDGGVSEYPFSEVVEDTQPVMSWKAFGQFYSAARAGQPEEIDFIRTDMRV